MQRQHLVFDEVFDAARKRDILLELVASDAVYGKAGREYREITTLRARRLKTPAGEVLASVTTTLAGLDDAALEIGRRLVLV